MQSSQFPLSKSIELPLNKSILNRYLVLKYLYDALPSTNFDNNIPEDTILLYNILKEDIPEYCNCDNAGTVLRFVMAIAAVSGKNVWIGGSKRMHTRPCKDLVDALRQLGAKIEYIIDEGCPPVETFNTINTNNYPRTITCNTDTSSQFVSAIMMIAPRFSNGLRIELVGQNVSFPYIEMTSKMMNAAGLVNVIEDNIISIAPRTEDFAFGNIMFERDWSAAAFWITILSGLDEGRIALNGLTTNSIQGDKAILDYLPYLGIDYTEENGSIILSKSKEKLHQSSKQLLNINLINTPDLFPPLAVAFALSNIDVHYSGLDNLIHKESNRIEAVLENLELLSYKTDKISDSEIIIFGSDNDISEINSAITINTHKDHRIAMAFAIFEYLNKNIRIDDRNCVKKSYPAFFFELRMES